MISRSDINWGLASGNFTYVKVMVYKLSVGTHPSWDFPTPNSPGQHLPKMARDSSHRPPPGGPLPIQTLDMGYMSKEIPVCILQECMYDVTCIYIYRDSCEINGRL